MRASIIICNLISDFIRPLWDCCFNKTREGQINQLALDTLKKDQVRGGGSLAEKNISNEMASKHVYPSRWQGLESGDAFKYGSEKYLICKTKGDGACALHAVLGRKTSSGLYEFSSSAVVRVHFAEELFQVDPKSAAANALKEYLTDTLHRLVAVGACNQEDLFLLCEIKDYVEKIKTQLKAAELANMSGDRHVDELFASYAKLPEIQNAYLRVCQMPQYQFSDPEIGIMAKLFDKKVVLFGENSPNCPAIYHEEGKETVYVHFSLIQGNNGHYSRIEVLN